MLQTEQLRQELLTPQDLDFINRKTVTYSKRQLQKFILPFIYALREGEWPFASQEIASGIQFSPSYHAKYEFSCMIAGEVDARIEMIGYKGKILYDYYTEHCEIVEICQLWSMPEWIIRKDLRRMIDFIKGFTRSRVDYQTWLNTNNKELCTLTT